MGEALPPPWPTRRARRATDPLVAAGLALLCPGLGHAWLGRSGKAILTGGLVLSTFAAGCVIGGFEVVHPERQFLWFIGQAFGGAMTLAAWALSRADRPFEPSQLGLLYTCVASLLNFLLALDAADTALRDLRPPAAPSPAGAPPPTVAVAPDGGGSP